MRRSNTRSSFGAGQCTDDPIAPIHHQIHEVAVPGRCRIDLPVSDEHRGQVRGGKLAHHNASTRCFERPGRSLFESQNVADRVCGRYGECGDFGRG